MSVLAAVALAALLGEAENPLELRPIQPNRSDTAVQEVDDEEFTSLVPS